MKATIDFGVKDVPDVEVACKIKELRHNHGHYLVDLEIWNVEENNIRMMSSPFIKTTVINVVPQLITLEISRDSWEKLEQEGR